MYSSKTNTTHHTLYLDAIKLPLQPHLHELIVQHSVRPGAGCLQEGLQALPGPVVHTVGTHHVQLLQAQVLLHCPQRLHLSTDERFNAWQGSMSVQVRLSPGAAPLPVAPGPVHRQQSRSWQGRVRMQVLA